jgi:hypothetical protein
MAKFVALLALTLLFATSVCFGEAQKSEKKLIQVKPAYSEAPAEPQAQVEIDPYAPVPPRPRDQLYVFWILGRLISYPIDKAESYIYKIRSEWKREGTPVPAAAGPDRNPFHAVNSREIPPAPPVSDSTAIR